MGNKESSPAIKVVFAVKDDKVLDDLGFVVNAAMSSLFELYNSKRRVIELTEVLNVYMPLFVCCGNYSDDECRTAVKWLNKQSELHLEEFLRQRVSDTMNVGDYVDSHIMEPSRIPDGERLEVMYRPLMTDKERQRHSELVKEREAALADVMKLLSGAMGGKQ